ncbi:hypothetical protein I3843_05G182700 [Carya illinoinensis]|nr:hypothetical protein I3843_05G182700 [Carya illinoinensis]
MLLHSFIIEVTTVTYQYRKNQTISQLTQLLMSSPDNKFLCDGHCLNFYTFSSDNSQKRKRSVKPELTTFLPKKRGILTLHPPKEEEYHPTLSSQGGRVQNTYLPPKEE